MPLLNAMPVAEVDSTQGNTVPQLMDTPNGGISGGKSVEVPSLDVFESPSATDQWKSSESDTEIPAPSAMTPGCTTRSLQGEMSPDLGSKFVRYRSEDSSAALDVTDGEKEVRWNANTESFVNSRDFLLISNRDTNLRAYVLTHHSQWLPHD